MLVPLLDHIIVHFAWWIDSIITSQVQFVQIESISITAVILVASFERVNTAALRCNPLFVVFFNMATISLNVQQDFVIFR